MVSIELATKVFSEAGDAVCAFEDVAFSVESGEIVAVLGPSGCGKTTLLRCVAGLESITRGLITVSGEQPAAARDRGLAAFVAQAPVLLPWRRLLENVGLPLEIRNRPNGVRPNEALDSVGLGAFASRYPHELSGGMRQRAAFARALVWSPPLLLLDEPFSALDEAARADMNQELRRMRDRLGTTILLVTHSLVEAVFCAERIVVLSPRPGRMLRTVTVQLPRERNAGSRSSEPFDRALHEIRGVIQ